MSPLPPHDRNRNSITEKFKIKKMSEKEFQSRKSQSLFEAQICMLHVFNADSQYAHYNNQLYLQNMRVAGLVDQAIEVRPMSLSIRWRYTCSKI